MAILTTENRILLEKIDQIDKISDQEWKVRLAERKMKELEFHDRARCNQQIEKTINSDTYDKFYGNKKYYSITKRSNQYVKDWISKESKGNVFLDYACRNGSNAIFAAQTGGTLSLGFDISGVSVENARDAASGGNFF